MGGRTGRKRSGTGGGMGGGMGAGEEEVALTAASILDNLDSAGEEDEEEEEKDMSPPGNGANGTNGDNGTNGTNGTNEGVVPRGAWEVRTRAGGGAATYNGNTVITGAPNGGNGANGGASVSIVRRVGGQAERNEAGRRLDLPTGGFNGFLDSREGEDRTIREEVHIHTIHTCAYIR
jgi:hypothetical protein